jgi:hypothetical protein
MLINVNIGLSSLCERFFKLDFLFWDDLLCSSGFVVSLKLVVGELENSALSDLTIDGLAVWTLLRFSALLVDFLAYLGTLEIVNIRPSKFSQILPTFSFGEQDTCTVL